MHLYRSAIEKKIVVSFFVPHWVYITARAVLERSREARYWAYRKQQRRKRLRKARLNCTCSFAFALFSGLNKNLKGETGWVKANAVTVQRRRKIDRIRCR